MDRRLQEAVVKGDVRALQELIEEDEHVLEQRALPSLNTILHLAARFGHAELAAQLLKLRPEMVSAENGESETPLHEACREGRVQIMGLLLETDPWVAYKLNCRDESVLFVAAERGRIEVVKVLLEIPSLLMMEVDSFTSSLHVAASSGHSEILKEILKVRPDFAWKKDLNGCIPLHLACSKGHVEITRELLRLDLDLSSKQDNEGRTPLHWAAIKGRVNIIDEILSLSLGPAEMITNNGETVLHLAVKNNHYESVKYLTESLNITKLINMQDSDGNTVLHLAIAGKLTTIVTYLLKMGVDVNVLNRKGYTALDVVEADASNSGALVIVPALQEAGAKRCDQLSPAYLDIQQITRPSISPPRLTDTAFKLSSCRPKTNSQSPVSPYHHHQKHNRHRKKQLELQYEGLRNSRKTITVVAVLIATVTFAAGISPPGGFNQVTGKAIRGKYTAFKVFLVCNIMALFLSLGIVNVLVSIIPFRRKSLMNLMVFTHKIMWVSTLFMASAYIAAIWTIMPQQKGTRWVSAELLVVGGGSTIVVFGGLGMMLARHWYKKHLWRKNREKNVKDGSPNSSTSRVAELKTMRKESHEDSSNSDVDSSDHGYHLY